MQPRNSLSLRRSLLATSLLCAIAPAFADEPAKPTELDDVIVTATRTAQTQDATLAAVDVITRADIERLQPQSLPELLRGSPGLTISNNGGAGKASSVFLRGTESDHVLVLVDGVRIGSATLGTAALQGIPVDQIERVEIVRGPFSSLYGADALGGVIQIFTRRPHQAFEPNASAAIGSFRTSRGSAGLAGRSEGEQSGWYSVQAAYETTDGINAYRDNPANPYDAPNPDRDGYRNRSLSVAAGQRFSQAWDIEGRALRTEGRNEYDGGFSNMDKTVQQVVGTRVHYAPTETIKFTLGLGRADDKSDNFFDDTKRGSFNSQRNSGSLQADFGFGDDLLTVGYDWRQDEVDSTTTYERDSRLNRAVFAQWQGHYGAQSVQVGLRHDDDSQFGGETTGSALWGWDFTDTLRLTASYGTAYKAPTFNELYYPGFGNPNLSAEKARSFELGLRGKQGWGIWAVNVFETRADDLIAYDPTLVDATHPFGQPNNVDEARIRGVEATVDTEIAGWTVHGAATLLDPRDDSNDGYDANVLARRARTSGRIDVDRTFGHISLGTTVNGSGYRYDDPANFTRMGGYGTTDLRVAFTFTPAWTLQLNANNVFDKRYETAAFYNQPGRNYLLSLRYRPAK
ncbi:TonB-dependent vitamin B12 receptor [Lysobacter tyrosinilyticus]